MGKLGGLQNEHQCLRLRKLAADLNVCSCVHLIDADTGLSEMIVPMTRTEQFNKSLEIQQSEYPSFDLPSLRSLTRSDLLASYEISAQITAIEGLISQGADRQTVTRLLCLASLINGGIKTKTLDNIKREFLQVGPNIYELHRAFVKSLLTSIGIWIRLSPSFIKARIPQSWFTHAHPYPSVVSPVASCC